MAAPGRVPNPVAAPVKAEAPMVVPPTRAALFQSSWMNVLNDFIIFFQGLDFFWSQQPDSFHMLDDWLELVFGDWKLGKGLVTIELDQSGGFLGNLETWFIFVIYDRTDHGF